MHRSSGSLVSADCQSKSLHLDRYVAGTWPRINRLFWATGLSFENRTISWSLTATVFRSTDSQNRHAKQESVSIACQLTYLVTKGKVLGKNDSNCWPIHHSYSTNNSPIYCRHYRCYLDRLLVDLSTDIRPTGKHFWVDTRSTVGWQSTKYRPT